MTPEILQNRDAPSSFDIKDLSLPAIAIIRLVGDLDRAADAMAAPLLIFCEVFDDAIGGFARRKDQCGQGFGSMRIASAHDCARLM